MKIPQGQYNFNDYEKEIKNFWLSNNFYKPEYNPKTKRVESTEEMKKDSRQAFSIICPPPNAYGRPHMGNLSGYAYQDLIGRYQRMKGKKVLLLPGKDHAGLEGEGVFIREVLEKEGVNKFDLTREDFYKKIWDFNMQNKELALNDEKTIGLSADFDRDLFTLDPRIVNTVLSTFIDLYNQDMVYKGVRIVNWDPKARSVIADNQCERKEKDGFLYYINYPLVRQRAWTLNFHIEDIFQRIKNREKTTELRALNPEEKDRYFGDIKAGDILILKNKVSNTNSVYKKVSAVHIFTNFSDALNSIDWQNAANRTFINVQELKEFFVTISEDYEKKIEKNGLISIEFEDVNEFLTVATTRPETMLGDTALVVNPSDPRYKDLIGLKAIVPLADREIDIIYDHKIEKEFGTGVLKLTPSHAQDDYEIMQRWNSLVSKESHDNSSLIESLPKKREVGYINVINKDLKICGPQNKYSGLKSNAAKIEIISDLKELEFLIKEESIKQNVLVSERTGATVEPIMSSQWFMDIDKIKKPVIEMVATGQIKIHPKSMEKKFYYWMENLRDWAISRSLWWGYRIPVWYRGEIVEQVDDNGQVALWIKFNDTKTQLDPKNPEHMRVQIEKPEGEGWKQEEDVLDTWFSSGQWPYATLQVYNLMDTFYPTDVMETGYDILENWVSRMMMFSYFNLKKIPFKHVYLHGLVKGNDGQKMSKSKKNIIPMDDVEKNYGIDALRMCYFYQNKAGRSYAITFDKLKNFRNFNNKIWNAAKYVLKAIEDHGFYDELKDIQILHKKNYLSQDNKNIIEKFLALHKNTTENLDKFRFGKASEELYNSFWHEFCDVYIEKSKNILQNKEIEMNKETLNTLNVVLFGYIKLLYPFIPFVTEKVFSILKENNLSSSDQETLMYSNWEI